MAKNVVAIVQARTGATRLPGKVFLPLCEQPLIWHVFNRLKYSKRINHCVLATTTSDGDDQLERWAQDENVACYRGSETDVLSRYYHAAVDAKADVIVRITADDPFKDPEIIDKVIDLYFEQEVDFAYNNNPPSFPEGLDVEVFGFSALQQAHEHAKDDFEREHVTQYFYRNPGMFTHANLAHKENVSYLRWTIDTAEDYAMAKKVYEYLYKPGRIFLSRHIMELLQHHPEIAQINQDVKRSAMYK